MHWRVIVNSLSCYYSLTYAPSMSVFRHNLSTKSCNLSCATKKLKYMNKFYKLHLGSRKIETKTVIKFHGFSPIAKISALLSPVVAATIKCKEVLSSFTAQKIPRVFHPVPGFRFHNLLRLATRFFQVFLYVRDIGEQIDWDANGCDQRSLISPRRTTKRSVIKTTALSPCFPLVSRSWLYMMRVFAMPRNKSFAC